MIDERPAKDIAREIVAHWRASCLVPVDGANIAPWENLICDIVAALAQERERASDEAVEYWLDDLGRQMRQVGIEPRKDENEIITLTNIVKVLRAQLAEMVVKEKVQRQAANYWFAEANREHNDRIRAEVPPAEEPLSQWDTQ